VSEACVRTTADRSESCCGRPAWALVLDGRTMPSSQRTPKQLPRIAQVRAWVKEDTLPGGSSFPPRNSVEAEERTSGDVHGLGRWIDGVPPWPPICNPMSIYDQYSGPRSSWGIGVHGLIVCEVVAEDGTYGCGITSGGEAGCWIIERHLSRFVEGRDPHEIELMWDQMWRASMPYGRKGIAVHALSAVDLALWCVGWLCL
jgi:hypothetical protein